MFSCQFEELAMFLKQKLKFKAPKMCLKTGMYHVPKVYLFFFILLAVTSSDFPLHLLSRLLFFPRFHLLELLLQFCFFSIDLQIWCCSSFYDLTRDSPNVKTKRSCCAYNKLTRQLGVAHAGRQNLLAGAPFSHPGEPSHRTSLGAATAVCGITLPLLSTC